MLADAGAPDGKAFEVVVAGHLCLDVIPAVPHRLRLEPGALSEVGAVAFAPGGGVANVGLGLGALGVRARLLGKLGTDVFGRTLQGLLAERDAGAARGLIVDPDAATSYTLVISPPGTDRMFLHHPGCNDAFRADDVDPDAVAGARLFYFGYPPLMREIYDDGGRALARLLGEVRRRGVTTVLDMAMPDAAGPAGRVDWEAFLARVLPEVDLLTPSIDEMAPMLGLSGEVVRADGTPGTLAATVAERGLALGAGAVMLTMGAAGACLWTAAAERLAGTLLEAEAWAGRALWAPALEVEVVGTTGAGDAATAGLMTALLRGYAPERALALATAAGASCVEAADATSGVPPLEALEARLERGWRRRVPAPARGDWTRTASGLYRRTGSG